MSALRMGKRASSLSLGMIEAYTFDGAALTSSLKGHTLTNNNTATLTTGKIGNGVNLVRASNQYLSIASGSAADFNPSGDFTVALWANLTSIPGEMVAVSKFLTTGNQRAWDLEISASSGWAWTCSSGGVATVTASSGTVPSLGVWHCVIAWYDSTAQRIRMKVNDNASISSVAYTGGLFACNADLNIGSLNNGGFARWNGKLDNIIFWNRVLTNAEHSLFYRSGVGVQPPFR